RKSKRRFTGVRYVNRCSGEPSNSRGVILVGLHSPSTLFGAAGHLGSTLIADAMIRLGYRLLAPLTTISTFRLPHREHASRLPQSGTVISAPYRSAISSGSGLIR